MSADLLWRYVSLVRRPGVAGGGAALAPVINAAGPIDCNAGVRQQFQPTLLQGSAPITWGNSGIPIGWTVHEFNTATGFFDFTPDDGGTVVVEFTASNVAGMDAENITFEVAAAISDLGLHGGSRAA